MRAEVESLEDRLGYRFSDRAVLRRALTHSSHAHENPPAAAAPLRHDNEQLEFLGDSVLGFLVSELLVERFPSFAEGRLSTIKAQLVNATHLLAVAHALDLGRYLQLGRSEEMTGGRSKKALLADAVEALIAALYLDGGLEAARAFVRREVVSAGGHSLDEFGGEKRPPVVDFKTALQELARVRKLPMPRYVVLREEGPSHSRTFVVQVHVGPDWTGIGDGPTKKSAAQKAAREVYQRLSDPPPGGSDA